MSTKICVIGGGRWGKNHIRTLHQLNCLGAIVDTDNDRLNFLLKDYPVKGYNNFEDAVNDGYDGYVVATPASVHYKIGKYLLSRGLNVLVEKPMTLSVKDSEDLVKTANKNNGNLMVGHVLLFHPAIIKIKELLDTGAIGDLYYMYSTRLNLGTVRTEENVFWSFAPHDISILNYFADAQPISIDSTGSKFLQKNVYDYTMTQFIYPNDIHAHIFVSWLHPFKEQRLVLVGSKGMISFDDSTKEKEILFYDKRIDFQKGIPTKIENPTKIIEYEKKMPLTEELIYFINNLDKGFKVSDGNVGLEVVRVLEEAEDILNKKS